MKYPILTFVLTLTITFFAKETFGQRAIIGVGIVGGIPTQEFRYASPDLFALGATIQGAFQIQNSPVYLGADFSFLAYGMNTEDWEIDVNGQWEQATFHRNNNVVQGHFLVRLLPTKPMLLKPYFDGLIGFKYIYTRSYFELDEYDEILDANTEVYDWVTSWGGAAGILFRLNSFLALDLKIHYLNGGRAEYLKPDGVTYDYDSDTYQYDITRSHTDMFLPQIGVNFLF